MHGIHWCKRRDPYSMCHVIFSVPRRPPPASSPRAPQSPPAPSSMAAASRAAASAAISVRGARPRHRARGRAFRHRGSSSIIIVTEDASPRATRSVQTRRVRGAVGTTTHPRGKRTRARRLEARGAAPPAPPARPLPLPRALVTPRVSRNEGRHTPPTPALLGHLASLTVESAWRAVRQRAA